MAGCDEESQGVRGRIQIRRQTAPQQEIDNQVLSFRSGPLGIQRCCS
jgi:hypothetical protein